MPGGSPPSVMVAAPMALRAADAKHLLVRLFGWRATLLHGDTGLFDRWRWARRHLRAGPVRTLDVGSGSGTLSIYAAHIGNDVTGISYDARLNEVARERARLSGVEVRLLEIDLRELDGHEEGLGRFDQVLCLEVIEHLLGDRRLVATLARLLEPGGRLLLSTPSARHRRLFGEVVTPVEDGRHVRFGYEPEQLVELVEAAGLRVERLDEVGGFVSQQITNAMRAVARVNYQLGWALTLPLRPLQALDGPLTRLLRWPRLSLAVVAVRPPA